MMYMGVSPRTVGITIPHFIVTDFFVHSRVTEHLQCVLQAVVSTRNTAVTKHAKITSLLKLYFWWNLINFIDQKGHALGKSFSKKRMWYNWDDDLDKEKEGGVRNSVGREHSERTRKGFDSLSGGPVKGEVSDASKPWALITGKMVDLLRNVRKGDCFGGKSWWVLW